MIQWTVLKHQWQYKMWTFWAKALGAKAFDDNKRADKVALIRTALILFEVIVGIFIILNAIANHGWELLGI
jgi:hypothetical protein